jgi:hypothetical protein
MGLRSTPFLGLAQHIRLQDESVETTPASGAYRHRPCRAVSTFAGTEPHPNAPLTPVAADPTLTA